MECSTSVLVAEITLTVDLNKAADDGGVAEELFVTDLT